MSSSDGRLTLLVTLNSDQLLAKDEKCLSLLARSDCWTRYGRGFHICPLRPTNSNYIRLQLGEDLLCLCFFRSAMRDIRDVPETMS